MSFDGNLINFDRKELQSVPSSSSLPGSDGVKSNCGPGNQIYSQESVLSAMDRFVNSVTNMSTCILVPSKLRDLEVTRRPQVVTPKVVHGSDMYQVYKMLNGLKQDFIYGPESNQNNDPMVNEADDGYMNKEPSTALDIERDYNLSCSAILRTSPSSSSASSCLESIESDETDGSDALLSSEEETEKVKTLTLNSGRRRQSAIDVTSRHDDEDTRDSVMSVANRLKFHLRGMQDILNQLSDSADFIATLYQDEIEGENSSDPCARSEQLRFKDPNPGYNFRGNGNGRSSSFRQ